MKELYVVNCCRTAIGSFGGALKNTPAVDLGAIVIKEALNRAGVKPEQVDEVMFGCILTAAQGQNVARQASIKAGIPYSVPAYTVGMVCGSGMKSMIEGARSILAGDADVVVCGGTENMSAAPYAVPTGRYGARMGHTQMIDTMIKDGLWDAYNNYHMGTTAENIADIWGITRKEMDEFAASSQQKTEAAQKAGKFEAEIVPVPVKVKKDIVEFKVDEFPRAGVTIDDIDLVEANEAFAAQSIAVARELGFDMSKVNVNGGAISLGHPVGASGARIIVTLLHEMQKRPEAKKGLATLCIGGGMGVATVFEKC